MTGPTLPARRGGSLRYVALLARAVYCLAGDASDRLRFLSLRLSRRGA